MRKRIVSIVLCIFLVSTALLAIQTAGSDYVIKKVKVIPVPWQVWRLEVNGVTDIIFFDPPQMPEDEVAIVREYAVLDIGQGPVPLEDLTWDGTEYLAWVEVDDPKIPYILPLNAEVELFIPIASLENTSAVLVRYTVAWASTPYIIEAHFVNEAVLESKSPTAIVGSLSNFDVHNDYPEPIDNFELEFFGNITPADVIAIYDPPGPPFMWNTSFGTVWYGGWGAPPVISTIPNGIKIEWIDPDNPVPFCQWIHFGVILNPDVFLWGAKAYLTQLVPKADIDIDPDTLNLHSRGRWITCYIELPSGMDAADIDISTVKISDINGIAVDIPAESHPATVDDYDGDGISDLMVKFDRSEVEDNTSPGDATITVTGALSGGSVFEGQDTIKATDLP